MYSWFPLLVLACGCFQAAVGMMYNIPSVAFSGPSMQQSRPQMHGGGIGGGIPQLGPQMPNPPRFTDQFTQPIRVNPVQPIMMIPPFSQQPIMNPGFDNQAMMNQLLVNQALISSQTAMNSLMLSKVFMNPLFTMMNPMMGDPMMNSYLINEFYNMMNNQAKANQMSEDPMMNSVLMNEAYNNMMNKGNQGISSPRPQPSGIFTENDATESRERNNTRDQQSPAMMYNIPR